MIDKLDENKYLKDLSEKYGYDEEMLREEFEWLVIMREFQPSDAIQMIGVACEFSKKIEME